MRTTITITAALALASLCACQPHYDGLQIRYLTSSGQLSEHGHLAIEEGDAVAIQVKPLSDNPYEDYEKFDLVELESFNDSVLRILPASDVDMFVLLGAGVGETSVRVSVNDHEEDVIGATVEAQVAP